jgi:hypothetical protein
MSRRSCLGCITLRSNFVRSIGSHLPHDIFPIIYRWHAGDELEQNHTKAVDITLVSELPRQKVLWIKVALEADISINSGHHMKQVFEIT